MMDARLDLELATDPLPARCEALVVLPAKLLAGVAAVVAKVVLLVGLEILVLVLALFGHVVRDLDDARDALALLLEPRPQAEVATSTTLEHAPRESILLDPPAQVAPARAARVLDLDRDRKSVV